MKTIPQKPRKSISLSILFGLFGSFIIFFLIVLFFHFMQYNHHYGVSLLSNTLAGKPAPQTSLPLLENEKHLLNTEQFKGRVTLVNFWGSWCSSCRKEHSLLMKIAQDQRFDLIGINYKDNKENAQRFLRNFGNPFKVIGFDVSGHTAINWGVYGPPETFLLNKESIVIAKHVGPLTWQIYQKKILPQIEKAIMTEKLSDSNILIHKDNLSFFHIERELNSIFFFQSPNEQFSKMLTYMS
ncbi:periplasmic protein thiol:disulfide oxidoreductase, DsbE subfamily [Bartonella vinsonii subsp. arupensis Pm136co]|uniref:Periplasmic protein thiol:disulfide oxidoreductase, DsbE subfamily n=1 Tax=Bartonella vinsonii subsp. arupensis Pm136co TaxID=1094561 RepID=A0ABP2QT50_BARVI|nr:DsbE family thiol:disulfide interchange protein [Bartonella vinsonii]EJF98114.1 periplasmic protein thiol:disulfide oxidoreductase, DsbE subfamily [Bartonella vinsonii subsp. arupensis Pm136co]